MEQLKYISLSHITGGKLSTYDTVALFNSVRYVKTDSKGKKYLETAIKPHLMGVLVQKEYLS